MTAPPQWSEPLPRTYQWQFSDFEPRPGPGTDWWKAQSPFDVTLAFTGPSGPSPIQASWRWSSVARGFGGSGYNSLDYEDFTTCWAEGVPGPGIGQWVQARFKRPTTLRELRILPGNNDYGSSFWEFARPKTLTAIFSDGSSTLLHLSDSPTLQRFPVHVTTRFVRFVIRSVYLGTDYPATCISLVEFGSKRAPGYAPFRRLIADPQATGRLTAWAGPPAPAPRFPASARELARGSRRRVLRGRRSDRNQRLEDGRCVVCRRCSLQGAGFAFDCRGQGAHPAPARPAAGR